MNLNCFYFGKFGYTIVPWQIKEDLDRIAGMGCTYITLNVLEQDFKAAHENIHLVIALSRKRGLKILAAPDGWGNLIGNFSGFPSVYAVKKQKYCLLGTQQKPVMTGKGWLLDPQNKNVVKFFKNKVKEVLVKFDFDGVFWYQPDERASIANSTNMFKELHSYCIKKYPEKELIYHPKNSLFLNNIHVQRTQQSVIVPRTMETLKQWKLTENTDNILASYFDYPPNAKEPERLMLKLKRKLQIGKKG